MRKHLLRLIALFLLLFPSTSAFSFDDPRELPPLTGKLPIPATAIRIGGKVSTLLKRQHSVLPVVTPRLNTLPDEPRSWLVIGPLPRPKPLPIRKPLGPDPIRFTMQANKTIIAIGEEFEIAITAELLPILPSQLFFLESQRAFSLKVLMPEGFEQTGGDYYDYIGADFGKGATSSATYLLRGRLTKPLKEVVFTLLRGAKDASTNSFFEKKQELRLINDQQPKEPIPAVTRVNSGTGGVPTSTADTTVSTFSSALAGPGAPTLTSVNSSVCDGQYTTLLVTGCNGGGIQFRSVADGYQWCSAAATSGATSIYPIQAGSYMARCVVSNGGYIDNRTNTQRARAAASAIEYDCSNTTVVSNWSAVYTVGVRDCNPCQGQSPNWGWTDSYRCSPDVPMMRQRLKHDYNGCTNQGDRWVDIQACSGECGGQSPNWGWTDNYRCSPDVPMMRQRLEHDYNGCTNQGDRWVDIQACSGECGGQSPNWGWTDNYRCSPDVPMMRQRLEHDYNGCTNQGDRWVDIQACSGECGGQSPNWGWTDNYRCSPDVPMMRQRLEHDYNGCTNQGDRWVDVQACSGECGGQSPNWQNKEVRCNGGNRQWWQHDDNGCSNQGDRWGDVVEYNSCQCISLSAPADPTFNGGNISSTCQGTPITFSSSCPTGQVHWKRYDSPGGTMIGQAIQSQLQSGSETPPGQYYYSVECSSNNCSGPIKTFTFIVVAPSPPILSASQSTICSGNSSVLTAANCAGVVTWSTGQVGVNSITVTPTATTQYNAICTLFPGDGSSCQSPVASILIRTQPDSPTVHLAGSTATSLNICPNGTVSLVAEGCQAALNWYRQDPGGGLAYLATVNPGAPFTLSTPTNATYVARCHGYGPGCTDSPSSQPIVVRVRADAPTAHLAGSTATSLNTCAGTSFTLQAEGCPGVPHNWFSVNIGGGETYIGAYNPGAGPTLTAQASPNSMTYVARCHGFSAECPANGEPSNPIVVRVRADAPTAHLAGSTATSLNTCAGTSFTLQAEGCPGVPHNWFSVNIGGGETYIGAYNPGAGPTLTAQASPNSMTYVARCHGFSAECPANGEPSNPIVVRTQPDSPTVHLAGSTATSLNICPNSTVSLVAEGCPAALNWYRQAPGGGLDILGTTSPGASFMVSTPTNATYVARCHGYGPGCIDSPSSQPIVVTVTTLPDSPTITARVAGTSSVQSITLTATGCAAGNTPRWSGPNNTTATGSSWILPFTQTSTYALRCEASTGCASQSATLTATFTTPSTPIIRASATLICAGDSVSLSASGCPTGATVLWSSGQTGATIGLAPTATANYTAVCQLGEVSGEASLQLRITVSNSVTVTGRTSYNVGETISLTAVSSAPGSVTYTWSGPAGYSQTGAVLQWLGAAVTQSGSYTVVARSTAGCVGKQVVAILVAGNTNVILTQALSPSAVCAGASLSVPFSTTGSFNAGNLYTVQLSDASGSFVNSTTLGSGTASPLLITIPAGTASGSYQVRVVSSYPITEGSTVPLTISGTASLSAGSNSPAGEVSVGGSLSLTTTGQNLTGAIYRWSGPNSYTSTAANPVIASSATANNGLYTVIATTPGGCTASAQTSVSLSGAASTATITGNLTICAGQSTTLTASGGSSYLWSTGEPSATVIVNPTTTSIYSVTVTSPDGTTSTANATITVHNKAELVASGNLAICPGTSTTLTASGFVSYNWSTGATNASVVVTPTATTSYSVSGTDINGCVSSTSVTVRLVTPTVTIYPQNSTICQGQSLTLAAGGDTNIRWSTGATTQSIPVSPTQSSVYSLTTINSTGCSAVATSTITVLPKPVLSISGNLTICAGGSTTLTASGGDAYLWSTGDQSPSVILTPSRTEEYSVSTIGSNGCITEKSITVQVPYVSVSAQANTTTQGRPTNGAAAGSLSNLTAGQAVELSATTNFPEVEEVSYVWTGPANFSSTEPSPSLVYSGTASEGAYSVQTTTQNGCIATAAVTISGARLGCDWFQINEPVLVRFPGYDSDAVKILWVTTSGCETGQIEWDQNSSFAIDTDGRISGQPGSALTLLYAPFFNGQPLSWKLRAKCIRKNSSGVTETCSAEQSVSISLDCFNNLDIVPRNNFTIYKGNATQLSVVGCENGVVTWSTGETGGQITVSPQTTTTYYASCDDGSSESCYKTARVVTVREADCSQFSLKASATSILKGDNVALTLAECLGTVTWSTGETGASINVTPLATTNYSVTCQSGQLVCTSSIRIQVASNQCGNITISTLSDHIAKGEYAILTALGCNGLVRWNNGLGDGSQVAVNPTITTTYVASCIIDNEPCLSKEIVIKVGNVLSNPVRLAGTCIDFVVDVLNQNIIPGQQAVLTASGCTGRVSWSSGSYGEYVSVSPQTTTTYWATCSSTGCQKRAVVNVAPPGCQSFTVESLLHSQSPYEYEYQAKGCTGEVKWYRQDDVTEVAVSGVRIQSDQKEYIAVCQSSGCRYKIANDYEGNDIPWDSKFFAAAAMPESIKPGESAKLVTQGCFGVVKWENLGSPGLLGYVAVSPATTTTYKVTCAQRTYYDQVQTGYVTVVVADANCQFVTRAIPAAVKNNSSHDVTLLASGCMGSVSWDHGLGNGVEVIANPDQTTVYKATCTNGSSVCYSTVVVPVYSCTNFSLQILTDGHIRASGCIGKVVWEGSSTTGPILEVTSNPAVTYVATCEATGCSANIDYAQPPGGIGCKTFSAKVTPGLIYQNESTDVTFTAIGCEAGTVTWSNGRMEASFTTALKLSGRTTYTAICKINGQIAETATTTVNVLPRAVVEACANFSIDAIPKDIGPAQTYGPGTKFTLKSYGCTGGTVQWLNSPASLEVQPMVTTTYYAECLIAGTKCVSPGRVTINIQDCSMFEQDDDDNTSCPSLYLTTEVGYLNGQRYGCPGKVTWRYLDENYLQKTVELSGSNAQSRVDIRSRSNWVFYHECVCNDGLTYKASTVIRYCTECECNSRQGPSQLGSGREAAGETSNCLPNLLSDVMAGYYEKLVCQIKDQWPTGSQQPDAFITRIQQATLQNPVLAGYSPNFTIINQQAVMTALQANDCKAAGQAIAKAFSGNVSVDDYYATIRPTYTNVASYLKNQSKRYYISPAGKAIELPTGATPLFFKTGIYPQGTLHGFKLADGKSYYADINQQAAVPTLNGYRLNASNGYYALPKLTVQGLQEAYLLIRYDENGVCGYRSYAGQYSFVDPNAVDLVIDNQNAPATQPLTNVVLENCAESEKVTVIEIEGNTFTLKEKDGNTTVVGQWNSFGKCADCPAKAEAALQAALSKARLANNAKLTKETVVIGATTQPYGSAGNVVYQSMKLMDVLTNLSKTYNALLDRAQVPPQAWQPGLTFYVRDETGVISGAIDQALEEAKDLPELVGLGLSVASDPAGAKSQLINFAQQMDWQKAQDLAEGLAKAAIQYDNFNKGGAYARYATGRVGVTLALIGASGGLLAVVQDAPNQLKRKLDDVLAIIAQLRIEVQDVVKKFSDKTFLKFGADLTDPDFFAWVNDPGNFLSVKGFLAHKEGVLTDAERQELAEMLDKDEITHPKAKEWLERSENVATFKGYTDAGRLFEANIKTALGNTSSSAYQGLFSKVVNLNQRTILSQVQFCIKGNCIGKGEYFIADFVAVRKLKDFNGNDYLDVVIIDTKLSSSTAFTPNQTYANTLSNLKVKSSVFNKVYGPDLDPTFSKDIVVTKSQPILKMISDGSGNFQSVN